MSPKKTRLSIGLLKSSIEPLDFFLRRSFDRGYSSWNKFLSLFLNYIQPDRLVEEIGPMKNEILIWNLRWMRLFFLFLCELFVVDNLFFVPYGSTVSQDRDKWTWKYTRNEFFYLHILLMFSWIILSPIYMLIW